MTATPWMKFYPTDWRSDPRLKMCGLAARGLWIEMIALMHEATPYGHLLVSGISPTDMQLAVLVGALPNQIPELIGELQLAGVFSRTKEGVIYSRKMTRMAKKSSIAKKNGKNGGNPSLCKHKGFPALVNQNTTNMVKPQRPEARGQKLEPERKKETKVSQKKRATRLSENWVLPDDWESVAISMGLPQNRIQPEADKMREWSMSSPNGAKLDWLASWRSWVRRVVEDNPAMQPTATNPDLVVLKQNDPDFRAVETLRGEPVLIGQNGTATFRKTEIEQARKALA